MNFRKFSIIFSIIAVIFLLLSGTILAVNYWSDNGEFLPGESPTPIPTDEVIGDNGPFNILLLGSETKKGYTDIIIVANYDPASNVVSLLSIPSNIKADVPAENGVKKLRSAYKAYGAEYTADLITTMFGIKFKYYFYFDYSAIKEIIDSLDGLEYELSADLVSDVASSGMNIDLKRGRQTFNGQMAVQFLSFKKPLNNKYSPELLSIYDGTDYSRTKLLQSFFREFCLQKLNPNYISKFGDIFVRIKNSIETNITNDDLAELADNARNINIQVCRTYILSGKDQTEGFFYFEFNDRIMETDTNREFNAVEIMNSYFRSSSFTSR